MRTFKKNLRLLLIFPTMLVLGMKEVKGREKVGRDCIRLSQ